jgi:hypothetical protein
LTDLQPSIGSTQIVSEEAIVRDMSKTEYTQVRAAYFVSILYRARRRELEMKHHLEVNAAEVVGAGMHAQAQAPEDCSRICDIVFGGLVVASNMSRGNGVLAVPLLYGSTGDYEGDLYLNQEKMQLLKEWKRNQETVDATSGALSDRQCRGSDQETYAKALMDCFRKETRLSCGCK